MTDRDEADEKIIAVPERDPAMCEYGCAELPAISGWRSPTFLRSKTLERSATVVERIEGRESAVAALARAIARYREQPR